MCHTSASNHMANIVTANSIEQLVSFVQKAKQSGIPIVDYGLAHAGLGFAPPTKHTKLIQQGTVLEHAKQDFTVCAQAGITFKELTERLEAENQFCPIDADVDITLGEIINHHVYGPLRVKFGAMRELLLGLHYLNSQAEDIHVGGRTVKNSAGYDVTRFMVASLGQLGLIHQATLRTYALPAAICQCVVLLDNPAAFDAKLTDLLLSDAAPAGIQMVYQNGTWQLEFIYMDNPFAIEVQIKSLKEQLKHFEANWSTQTQIDSITQYFQQQTQARAWQRKAAALVKVIVPPSQTGTLAKLAQKWNPSLMIQTLPTHGCVMLGGNLNNETAIELDQKILAFLPQCQGMRMWTKRPENSSINPFGPKQSEWPLLNQIKKTMDPENLFNPGRFLPVE